MRTVVAAILRIEFILQSSFKFTAVLSKRYRVPFVPCPNTCKASPLSTSACTVVHVLKPVNLHSHIIIIQSPQFTLGFTRVLYILGGLDKCIMTCTLLQYHTEKLTGLKSSQALPVHSLHPTPGNPWIFIHLKCLHHFAFA